MEKNIPVISLIFLSTVTLTINLLKFPMKLLVFSTKPLFIEIHLLKRLAAPHFTRASLSVEALVRNIFPPNSNVSLCINENYLQKTPKIC